MIGGLKVCHKTVWPVAARLAAFLRRSRRARSRLHLETLYATHIDHGCRSDDEARDPEQAAYGQLASSEWMLERADRGFNRGARVSASLVSGSTATVTLGLFNVG